MNRELHSGVMQLWRQARGIASRADELLTASRTGTVDCIRVDHESPMHLAHYTSLEALVSMLQSPDDGLRLSDSATMNDPDEGLATSDDRVLVRLLEDEFGTESWVYQRYLSANVCCFVGIQGRAETIIDAGDDLLFWRLYGNDCRGVSITIAPHVSNELVRSSVVQQVIYTDEPPLQIDIVSISALLKDLERIRMSARAEGIWNEISEEVIPSCDRMFAARFLRKRSHYEMEHEFRAVAFETPEDADEGNELRIDRRGVHVQYGLVRRYIQIPELRCNALLTSNSQITIGSNVPDHDDAKRALPTSSEYVCQRFRIDHVNFRAANMGLAVVRSGR